MKSSNLVTLLGSIILLTPLTVFAQAEYNSLVRLPGVGPNPVADFDQFLNTLYAIAIAVAALLAVIKIVIAGVKYMLSDVVTSKAAAKADIQGALFGLIIVIGAVIILETINPGILRGDISSGQGVSGVNRSAGAPAETGVTYTANTADGYTWIPMDAPAAQRLQFRADCEADSTKTYSQQAFGSSAGNQIRCHDSLSGTTATGLSSALSGLSEERQNDILGQYQTTLDPWDVEDSATLSDIQSNLGASEVYFVVDRLDRDGVDGPDSAFPVQNNNSVDTTCNAIRQSVGDPGITVVNIDIDGDGTNDGFACVR